MTYPFLKATDDGVLLKLFIQPRSSKNSFAGVHGDALKLKITSPPVAGEANQMCLKFLAKSLAISKSSLEIVAGLTSRSKVIRFQPPDGVPPTASLDDLARKLNRLLT